MRVQRRLNGSMDDLKKDFYAVARDAEALLEATADAGNEKVQQARTRAASSLKQVQSKLGDRKLRRQASRLVRETDDYVRDHSWGIIGAAAGVALVLGFLLRRD